MITLVNVMAVATVVFMVMLRNAHENGRPCFSCNALVMWFKGNEGAMVSGDPFRNFGSKADQYCRAVLEDDLELLLAFCCCCTICIYRKYPRFNFTSFPLVLNVLYVHRA